MPPINLDPTYRPRAWACCECKTVLGVVMRDNGMIRRLYVFSVHRPAAELPTEHTLQSAPRGLFSVHGLDLVRRPGGVECQKCGALNNWDLGEKLMQKLIAHYRADDRAQVAHFARKL